ncbi:hypothetical protein [Maribellus maritimus]|uniref:hypothetical protein n=1 Tax=Maribellus maritimus TaxID=2870838 RepID=UPI001EEB08BD|nr:hypothetical protein [Maribellus maritimus]MCG6186818.1 hypothetical protein [Maribellus maritimus]
MKTDNENSNYTDLNPLISKLKKEDTNYAVIVRAVQFMYWIFVPFIGIMTVREYMDSSNVIAIISGVCNMLAFTGLALSFRKYYYEYKFVDYSLPTIQMLKKAVHRYQPFQKKSIRVLVPLILIDVALTLDWMEDDTSLFFTQAFFWGAILFGVIIGLILWYVRYKPIRDEAQRLVREIEGE